MNKRGGFLLGGSALIGLLAAAIASSSPASRQASARSAWPQFRFGPAHTGATPYEHALTASNVSRLELAWTYTTGGPVWSSPAVAGGVVYVGSNDGRLYALRLSDGAVLWTAPLGGRPSAPPTMPAHAYHADSTTRTYAPSAQTTPR